MLSMEVHSTFSKEITMLETYFKNTYTLNRLRASPLGRYIDGFAQHLNEQGYTKSIARRILNAGARFGDFFNLKDIDLDQDNPTIIEDFEQHLAAPNGKPPGMRTIKDIGRGARYFLTYLYHAGYFNQSLNLQSKNEPELIKYFEVWLIQHRGLSQSTVYKYCRDANKLITILGDDVSHFNAKALRDFLLNYAKQQGRGATKTMITGLRTFLRYLASQGKCQPGLENAIPTIANWRNASLPNYLQPSEVQRILDTCNTSTVMGERDKAIILLLVRLGLRAGDVARLTFSDIDWQDGSFIVSGKNHCEVRLPLPQDVGDAILAYLKYRRPVKDNAVFLRTIAPFQRFCSGSAVSTIVTRAMHKANVVSSRYGAHILRNTAATQMLQQGASLYEIGTVLRHQSVDTTARYTKVDITLLNLVVQPWPEVLQ